MPEAAVANAENLNDHLGVAKTRIRNSKVEIDLRPALNSEYGCPQEPQRAIAATDIGEGECRASIADRCSLPRGECIEVPFSGPFSGRPRAGEPWQFELGDDLAMAHPVDVRMKPAVAAIEILLTRYRLAKPLVGAGVQSG